MGQWIEDTQGLIKLPDTGGGYGVDRKVGVSLDAGFSGQARAPRQISALAEGLGPMAKAAGQWADVLARQEEEKQKLEALDWTMEFQDREREMQARMAEMKSKDGYDNSVKLAEEWYRNANAELMGKARGNFQKNYLGSFLAQSRNAGLNRAYAHRSQQLAVFHDQVWQGLEDQTLAKIEADPENHERYLAALDSEYALLNPGADPAYIKAKSRERRDKGLEAAVLSLGRGGKIDEAKRLLIETFGEGKGHGGFDERGELLWNKIQDLASDHLVKTLGDGVAAAYQTGSEAEIAAQVRQGYDQIAQVDDPDRKHRLESRYKQDISFHQTRRAAADMEATERFLAQAETEGWSPTQMKAKLREAEGFSRAARENLDKRIDEGTANKPSAANREATDWLMVEIDRRFKTDAPMTSIELEALAQKYGLTTEQINTVRKYMAEGGMAGQPGLAGKVNDIYKELTGSTANAPSGFIKLVAQDLPSGKDVSPDELQQAVAGRLFSTLMGESKGGGWGYGRDETYDEAARANRAEFWLPEVRADEKAGLDLELRAAGLKVNDYNRRLWKKSERLHLPISEAEKKQFFGSGN
jgi:hypothetical protein